MGASAIKTDLNLDMGICASFVARILGQNLSPLVCSLLVLKVRSVLYEVESYLNYQ